MVTTTANERSTPTHDIGGTGLPVNVKTIHDALTHALTLPLATTTREDIDANVQQVVELLRLLLGEASGYESDTDVCDLFRQAYALLDLNRRPHVETAAFEAFEYLRNTARAAIRLLNAFGASFDAPISAGHPAGSTHVTCQTGPDPPLSTQSPGRTTRHHKGDLMTNATIPFAARAAEPPCLVTTSIAGVTWDEDRQLNVQADGSAWHTADHAASTTDTNQDGKGDDVTDPYFAPAS